MGYKLERGNGNVIYIVEVIEDKSILVRYRRARPDTKSDGDEQDTILKRTHKNASGWIM